MSNSASCSSRKTPAGRAAVRERIGRVGYERNAVVLGPQVVGAVDFLAAAAIGRRRAHHDKLRQVFIERAQAIVHPGPDRREKAIEPVAARVKLKLRAVVDVVGPHRAHDREVIDASADVRPPITNLDAAFAALAVPHLQWIKLRKDLPLVGYGGANVSHQEISRPGRS